MKHPKILIIDDDAEMRSQVKRWLNAEDYEVDESDNSTDALNKVRKQSYGVILLDLKLPSGMDGFGILHELKKHDPDICVIILTAYGDPQTTRSAMQQGAFDFFDKPIRYGSLLPRIESAFEKFNASREIEYQSEEEQQKNSLNNIIGKSSIMQEMIDLIERVSKTDASVLILGESGTGKEMVAKAIHYNSRQKRRAWIVADCSTIAPSLIETELFGSEKGAFTGAITRKGKFERAHMGTIFIDEIGELDHNLQMKLLRFLQAGTIERVGGEDVLNIKARVLAATAVNLREAMTENRFRADLYHRLNEFTINIPPLRERKEDIPILVDHFIHKYNRKHLKNVTAISPKALEILKNHDYRGSNVRELEHIISGAIVLTDGDEIQPEAIRLEMPVFEKHAIDRYFSLSLREFTANCERDYIIKLLERNDWIISRAAQQAGIDRSNLRKKMQKYGIGRGDGTETA